MCTAATYKTKDFYFGRTLDYEFSYGDEITITPRNFPFKFRHINECNSHFAMIGMAHIADVFISYLIAYVALAQIDKNKLQYEVTKPFRESYKYLFKKVKMEN